MMTIALYQTDSYLQTFEAKVSSIDESNQSITLDQTAFYPGGGGQPADSGKIIIEDHNYIVKRAKRDGREIAHFLDNFVDFPDVGSLATGQIDWDHRYKLMRTHTAMHILCGVIFRDYGASVTGGDMQPLKGRMDFEFETMHRDLVEQIENAVNVEIVKAHPVTARIMPRSEAFQIPDLIRTKINLLPEGITEVRVVEIEGLDLQADGGTHVKNTSEVGRIKIVDYKSKGRINKRIYVEIPD
jgi:misacylated tRNA(Ala) deacylase